MKCFNYLFLSMFTISTLAHSEDISRGVIRIKQDDSDNRLPELVDDNPSLSDIFNGTYNGTHSCHDLYDDSGHHIGSFDDNGHNITLWDDSGHHIDCNGTDVTLPKNRNSDSLSNSQTLYQSGFLLTSIITLFYLTI